MTLKMSEVMTHGAHTIGASQPLQLAHERMREFDIRHLPVLEGGRVVGLVSIGDLHLLETLKDVRPEEVRVEEAMTSDVYTVGPETPVAEVAEHMADRKMGSAVVVDAQGGVMGVFTTVDALRAMALELKEKDVREASEAAAPPPATRGPARKAPKKPAGKAAKRPATKAKAKKQARRQG